MNWETRMQKLYEPFQLKIADLDYNWSYDKAELESEDSSPILVK